MVERSSARKRKRAVSRPVAESSDPAFDQWLDVRLKAIYDSVLNEPLPPDMLSLVRDRSKT